MRVACITLSLLFCLGAAVCSAAQLPLQTTPSEWQTEADLATFNPNTGLVILSNNVVVHYGTAVLVAEQATVDKNSGEVVAEGKVRIQSEEIVWVGEHVSYNFKTRQMQANQFRAGKSPFYVGGEGLKGDTTNQVYTATNGFITLDDYSEPLLKVRAKRLTVIPGEKFKASGAMLQIGSTPFFYLPSFSQRLDVTAPAVNLTPGFRSRYGGYVLGAYSTKWSEAVDTTLHLDYRTKRGVGAGADLGLHLGDWGDALLKYYYLHDMDAETNAFGVPYPEDRQRIEFTWLAAPFTNTTFKSRVSYETDAGLRREFFENEYRQNIQPSTFVEARHFWDNFSLSAIASPRVNDFYTSVERLPEVKLTAFRQQVGVTPVYYESESRVGYLRQMLADTNVISGLAYEAARADTYHQIVLPTMLFGWLNVTPRAGGRFTYYSEAEGPGATTTEVNRAVFNTGAETTTKISRTWTGVRNGMFDLDGLRHIAEPSVNYVYVPRPDARPTELPQFDSELPSLHLLPVEFPDYNAIDAVDTQNVIRWGLRNRLQTKRDGQVQDFLDWNVFTDWRLHPAASQETFSDIASELKLQPRTWLSFESFTRYNIESNQFRLAFNSVKLQPNNTWHWRLGYLYLRDDFSASPTAWGEGSELVTSAIYLRLSENWAVRALHYYNHRERELQEQSYTLYRDFRSWTGALSVRLREDTNGKNEYAVGFVFSLKALPRFGVGQDTIQPDSAFDY